jgi:hypothetical protein
MQEFTSEGLRQREFLYTNPEVAERSTATSPMDSVPPQAAAKTARIATRPLSAIGNEERKEPLSTVRGPDRSKDLIGNPTTGDHLHLRNGYEMNDLEENN